MLVKEDSSNQEKIRTYIILCKEQKVYENTTILELKGSLRFISGGNTVDTLFAPSKIWRGEFPDTDKNLEELYNEMFGWESYRKDARLYNEALEMYSRTTKRYHLTKN